jgi:hypothetical protein
LSHQSLTHRALRDAEGDSRVNVAAYVAAATAADRAVVGKDMLASDGAVRDGVTAYLAVHGSASDQRAILMRSFSTAFAAWRHVRDTAIRPAADAGDSGRAKAAMAGPLAAANDAMTRRWTPCSSMSKQRPTRRRHKPRPNTRLCGSNCPWSSCSASRRLWWPRGG